MNFMEKTFRIIMGISTLQEMEAREWVEYMRCARGESANALEIRGQHCEKDESDGVQNRNFQDEKPSAGRMTSSQSLASKVDDKLT